MKSNFGGLKLKNWETLQEKILSTQGEISKIDLVYKKSKYAKILKIG